MIPREDSQIPLNSLFLKPTEVRTAGWQKLPSLLMALLAPPICTRAVCVSHSSSNTSALFYCNCDQLSLCHWEPRRVPIPHHSHQVQDDLLQILINWIVVYTSSSETKLFLLIITDFIHFPINLDYSTIVLLHDSLLSWRQVPFE